MPMAELLVRSQIEELHVVRDEEVQRVLPVLWVRVSVRGVSCFRWPQPPLGLTAGAHLGLKQVRQDHRRE